MNKTESILNKIRFVLKTFLIITLIFGILTTSFGVGVVALSSIKNATTEEKPDEQQNTENPEETPTEFKDPIKEYREMNNTATTNENMKVISEKDSYDIVTSISEVETVGTSTKDNYTRIKLKGETHPALDNVSNGDVFFIQGDSDNALCGDRAYKLIKKYTSDNSTIIEVQEPEFEEVFSNIEYAATDYISESNLVTSYTLPGVTAHFGDIETELTGVTTSTEVNGTLDSSLVTTPSVQTLAADDDNKPVATQTAADKTDFIIELNLDFSEFFNNDEKDDGKDTVTSSFGIKGEVGIKDYATHIVFDVPEITDWRNFYIGQSGQLVGNIKPYGQIEISGESESGKKDFKILSLEALNEKRFPIGVWQFKGLTPVLISNKTFNEAKKSVVPNIFIIVYADWQGKISIELSGSLDWYNNFNNGLSVVKDGVFNPTFQEYPYPTANPDDDKGFDWNFGIGIEADTDLTLMGAGVLFYVAGVNIAEFIIGKAGFEAQCDIDLIQVGSNVQNPIIDEDATYYLRGYLKFICINIKIKAQGKGIMDFLKGEFKFDFILKDITLFELGQKPDKFKPKTPFSTMMTPDAFDSVIVLVTDASGSMGGKVSTGETKLEATKAAADMVIEFTGNWAKTYNQASGIGIVQFASNAKSIAMPHIDYEFLRSCVSNINDGGGTNIQAGIETAISQLDSVRSSNKIIILMTDGKQTTGNALTAANEAAKRGIKIFTIGFGSDADAGLLTSVATTTGGEYKYASTDSTMSIFGGFLYAQQSSEADVLTDINSTVSEGETTDATSFEVADKSGDLVVVTAWPGSFLDTILIDPNGRVVDEDYPNSVTDESKIPSTITVKNPIKGNWQVKIKGVETSYDKEPFYTIVSFKETDEQININPPMNNLEKFASYCIPIGFFVTISSALLLICMRKKKTDVKS